MAMYSTYPHTILLQLANAAFGLKYIRLQISLNSRLPYHLERPWSHLRTDTPHFVLFLNRHTLPSINLSIDIQLPLHTNHYKLHHGRYIHDSKVCCMRQD